MCMRMQGREAERAERAREYEQALRADQQAKRGTLTLTPTPTLTLILTQP